MQSEPAVLITRPTKQTETRAQGSARKHACDHTTNTVPSTSGKLVGSDSVCRQVSPSVIPLYTFSISGGDEFGSQHPPRPDAPQLTDEQFRNRIDPIRSTSFLEQISIGHPHCRRFHTAGSHCLDGPGLHHFIGTTQVSGPQPPPRFESSRLHDSIHHTLRFSMSR